MTLANFDIPVRADRRPAVGGQAGASLARRGLLLGLVALAAGGGFVITDPVLAESAAANAGEDLTRLLHAMAILKAAFVVPAVAGILWRLGVRISAPMFAAYVGSAVAMTLSIGLIWQMAHVGWGAVLMHAGLIGTLVLLFRDKVAGECLDAMLKARTQRRNV